MPQKNNAINTCDLKASHKEYVNSQTQLEKLAEENAMLFGQLQAVQEELERYYYKLKEFEELSPQRASQVAHLKLQVENIRLTALTKAYRAVRRAERHSSLQARIGESILKLSKTLLTAPFKLLSILLFFAKKTPSAILGGKEFTSVINAYDEGKADAVKKLVQSVNTTSIIMANAYTAVAKYLQKKDINTCVDFARLAYMTDPQDYRLKWWILRLDDLGDVISAEALLELLPSDVKMDDVEKSKVERIRQAALQQRKNKAGQAVTKTPIFADAKLQKEWNETTKCPEARTQELETIITE